MFIYTNGRTSFAKCQTEDRLDLWRDDDRAYSHVLRPSPQTTVAPKSLEVAYLVELLTTAEGDGTPIYV